MGRQCTLMSSCSTMQGLGSDSRCERLPPSFYTLFFADLTITADLDHHLRSIPRKAEKHRGPSHHSAQPRSASQRDDSVSDTPPHLQRWPHTAPECGPLHPSNEGALGHGRRKMFPFPLNWNVGMGEGCRSDRWGGSNRRVLSCTPHSWVSISRF